LYQIQSVLCYNSLVLCKIMCGVVYSAREAHNLTGWAQLPAPQQIKNPSEMADFFDYN